MLRQKYVDTEHELVEAEIARDSSRTLCCTRVNEKEFWIKMYNMETLELQFAEQILGDYLKMKLCAQNSTATKFALVYNDNGVFKLRTFGRENRT